MPGFSPSDEPASFTHTHPVRPPHAPLRRSPHTHTHTVFQLLAHRGAGASHGLYSALAQLTEPAHVAISRSALVRRR
eukprot:5121590-Pleurochrysis_carterae.AAC.3